VQVSGEAKPLPHKLAASALWLPTIIPGTNSNATAAMVVVLNVIVIFEFIYLYTYFI
jgi:hypothetical protein